MIKNIENNISLLKALLYTYKNFTNENALIALTFDRVFQDTTKDFNISREHLYELII